MFSPSTRVSALSILAGIALCACDGTGGPVLVPDTGPDERDAGMPDATLPDGGTPDETAPTIVSTDPDDGVSGVGATSAIAITFSERMAAVGTITATADGAGITLGAATWDATGTTVTVTPSAPLPSESRVRVIVGDDFSDVAGNSLALSYTFTFDVADTEAPTVTGSDPTQGATGISARTDAVTITFSEIMDSSVGTTTLTGGAGAIDGSMWIDGRTLRVDLEDLAYGAAYELALDGFTDASGNALDGATYLVDGAITFTTGADEDAPQLEDSVPSEGQINVALRGTPSVVLVFDEPMDATAGVATLHTTAGAAVLTGSWSDGNRRLTLPIAGRLVADAAHAVELTGFRDVAGNALDPIAYLGDGRLDFATGADVTLPVVVFSFPNEGSTDSDHRLARIEIAFDRAMDQAAVATVPVADAEGSFDAPVTWNLAGTRAYADVSNRIYNGRSYRVDLRAFVDLSGDAVDPSAPYLGDGVLDFGTRRPHGEQCRDELGITEATGTTPGGGYEWVIAETSMATIDNGPACRYPTADSASQSADAVIRYRKTTAGGSTGGRYLHVSVDAPFASSRATLAVYRDACGEMAAGGPAARLSCQWERMRWDQYLDVGAGDYYVWVATTGSTTQSRLVVRVEEVDQVPAGESCANPYTTTPGSPDYTPPATPGGEHTWVVPANVRESADMALQWPSAGAAACDADQVQGPDFVVRFDKQRADSLVSFVVDANDLIYYFNAEVLSSCDPLAAGTTSLACQTGLYGHGSSMSSTGAGPRRLTVRAPAGPLYLWVAYNRQPGRASSTTDPVAATIRAIEIDDAPGTSCANAIPLTAGTHTIAPSSVARVDAPSCLEGATPSDYVSGVTWYRVAATQNAMAVYTDAAATPSHVPGIAVVDATSGRVGACGQDARQVPVTGFVPVGSDVCIAVRSTSGIGRLDIVPVPYGGVRGRPTDLNITRPRNAADTADVTITSDQWMVTTPTTIYMSLPTSVVHAPISGNARADQRTLTAAQIGSAAVSIGEAVWSLDDASSGTATRLWRLTDATGNPTPVAWDTGTTWPADAYDGMAYDGTSFFVVSDYAATVPVEIRRFDATTPGAGTSVGAVHPTMRDTLGLAVDATWFYLAGVRQVDATTVARGVFRVRRSELGTAVPELIAPMNLFSSATTTTTLTARVAMAVDSTTAATVLYVRGGDGRLHVVADPGGAAPRHLGELSALGGYGDFAMAYVPSGPSIYLFETETVTTGNFVRLD